MRRISVIISALIMANSFAVSADADDTQCLYNDGGYEANVYWYDADAITYDSDKKTFKAHKKHFHNKKIGIGGWSCVTKNGKKVAYATVVDAKFAHTALEIGIDTAISAAGVVACAGSDGTACPEAAEVAGDLIEGISSEYLPSQKGAAYYGVPPQKHPVKLFGTAVKANTGIDSTRCNDTKSKC